MQCSALISYSCILQDCHLSGTCVSYATVNLLNKNKNKNTPSSKVVTIEHWKSNEGESGRFRLT